MGLPTQVFFLMSDIIFSPPTQELAIPLAPGYVHVWRFSWRTGLAALLSPVERAQYEKYRSRRAAAAFGAARAGIRRVAEIYTGRDPGAIDRTPFGKPFFRGARDFHFNISHCGDMVLAALSSEPVGLDVEVSGRRRDFAAIARRFFRAEEADEVARAGDSGEEVFLRLWTAKEAMLKLSGRGISGGLNLARVSPDGSGLLDEKKVFLVHFSHGIHVGAVASFSPFAVNDWFDL